MNAPFTYLFAPLETPEGWYMLLGRDTADPSKFQGFSEHDGSLQYDGCRCDNFHGPFKSLEELYKFAVNDLIDLIRECHAEAEELRTDIRNFGDEMNRQDQLIVTQSGEIDRYKKWTDDLQSGMYVNCVYCGHRYGPNETTPVSMADALKAHVEVCPKHPMSALRTSAIALFNALLTYVMLYPRELLTKTVRKEGAVALTNAMRLLPELQSSIEDGLENAKLGELAQWGGDTAPEKEQQT